MTTEHPSTPDRAATLERPWCCPEPTCTPLHQLANRKDLGTPKPGDTFHCFGKMLRFKANAAFLLAQTCPTGRHVGSVHARIEGGTMVLNDPPAYLCGCTDPRRPTEAQGNNDD